MKLFVVLAFLVAVALCAPPRHAKDDDSLRYLPAIRHEEVHDEFGQYALRYITAENTVVSERGRLVPGQNGGHVLEIEGQYSFIGDDGKVYVTKYRGGPDGFHVDAKHLPQPVRPLPA
ncbi:flexible cuticle protein 12-like [Pararge aegeria]|uniref:Jg10669 protein n=1 Tax=Pararge aegeria aegeria TaxID=348720 RepID=A0A8S4RUM6_9NEOP|nr:flexible cuticle protein 12-like [Pararge aegeria]CAH2241502.1 jg10669 [Pararge aegeria aegeria]